MKNENNINKMHYNVDTVLCPRCKTVIVASLGSLVWHRDRIRGGLCTGSFSENVCPESNCM